MAGAGEGGEEERHLVGRVQGYPRDLLRQFSGGVAVPEEAPAAASGGTEEDSGEIELSLGLSLGGYFGVDPARRRGLHRSSSIATIPLLQQQQEDDHAVSPPLKRTTSLPAEVEEEQRKRKEQQCLRRMEAKRKKSEKTNGSHPWARDPPAASPEEEGEGVPGWMRRPGTEQLDGWWAPNRVAARGGAAAAVEGTRGFAAASQGSVGSQGSSSSRASDSGGRPHKKEGLQNNGTDLWRSSSRTQPQLDLGEHKAPTVEKPAKNSAAAREEEVEAPCKEPPPAAAAAGGMSRRNGLKGAMEEMPCVSTRGVGPDGKLVEGFLYRYGKGEEVRIVCVCHGRFLSPAEFVRHAGGGDVAHPLRHIIVNPSPSCFL